MTNRTPNLFNAGPAEIRQLMDNTTDMEMLRLLARLEAAAESGDEIERIEAVDGLFDLLVLRNGVGL